MKIRNGEAKSPNGSSAAVTGPLKASGGRAADEWAALPERRSASSGGATPDFQEEVRRVLLGRYTPAAVLVDDALNVLHVHGHVSPFLGSPDGVPSANLSRRAKGSLGSAIRALVLRAKSEDRPIAQSVHCALDGRPLDLTIAARAIRCASDRRRRYLILFMSGAAADSGAGAADGQLEFSDSRRLIASPPVRDVNEELEAARAELHAINAELVAVNKELRKGNSELNAINDDLSNLLASAEIPILMLDRKMRVRRFTPPAEGIFGLAATDVGRSIENLKFRINAPFLKEAVRDVIAGFEAKQLEVRDRGERWYSLWIRPYRTKTNVIDGAVLSMTDITEKRNGIRALIASRDYAETIVDAVNDSLLVLNRHLKVKSASRSYYEMFMESPSELEGRSIYELGEGRWNVPHLRKQLAALAAQGTPFSGWEADFDVPKLGRRTLAISGRVVPHETEGEIKIVLAVDDVSLRRQAAEAAALRKSEARQREFVANVSHELMTPIAAIKGYAESLAAGVLEIPGKRMKFTQIIERNAERLAQLVEDLLQLSSFDAGRAATDAEAVHLRSSIDKLTRTLAPAARARKVTLRVLVPKTLRVSMNRAELAQVLQNLGENAIKYNRMNGRVTIRASRIGKRVLVSVSDTGIGIPKEDLPRIFDRFHRAENARALTARGNGLGLSIVRAILVNRGCRIWAESADGKGSSISFTLPHAEKPRR